MAVQGSADAFEVQPDWGNVTRYPDRFYLPECWTRPVSIEGADIDARTNHSLRKDSMIQSWRVRPSPVPPQQQQCPTMKMLAGPSSCAGRTPAHTPARCPLYLHLALHRCCTLCYQRPACIGTT